MSTEGGEGKGQRDSGVGRSGEGAGERETTRSAVNPLVAAAVGMALLSSDPAVTLAVQSAREAVVSSASPASTLVLSAETGSGELKSLLGEVRWWPKGGGGGGVRGGGGKSGVEDEEEKDCDCKMPW